MLCVAVSCDYYMIMVVLVVLKKKRVVSAWIAFLTSLPPFARTRAYYMHMHYAHTHTHTCSPAAGGHLYCDSVIMT